MLKYHLSVVNLFLLGFDWRNETEETLQGVDDHPPPRPQARRHRYSERRPNSRSTGPVHAVPPDGAAQVVLLGPSNTGKSTLHALLTGLSYSRGSCVVPEAGLEPARGL